MVTNGGSIAVACRALGVSETCLRYSPEYNAENETIVDQSTSALALAISVCVWWERRGNTPLSMPRHCKPMVMSFVAACRGDPEIRPAPMFRHFCPILVHSSLSGLGTFALVAWSKISFMQISGQCFRCRRFRQ